MTGGLHDSSRGGDSDGISPIYGCRTCYMVAGGKKGAKALYKRKMTVEERYDAFEYSRGIKTENETYKKLEVCRYKK